MADSRTIEKLDSLLRLHYNEAAAPGEKENALSLFEKKCKKEGIDPEEYKKRFESKESSESRSRVNSNSYNDFWGNGDLNDIFDLIFGRGRRHNGQRYNNYETRKKNEEYYRKKSQNIDYEAHSKYVKKDHTWYKIKDLIVENSKGKNHEDIVFISCLARTEESVRWALTNFVIYPNCSVETLMEKYFKPVSGSKIVDSEFILHADKNKKYFRDHYLVVKLWKLNEDGTETKILF